MKENKNELKNVRIFKNEDFVLILFNLNTLLDNFMDLGIFYLKFTNFCANCIVFVVFMVFANRDSILN